MDLETIRTIIPIVMVVLVTPLSGLLWYMVRKALSDIVALEKEHAASSLAMEKRLAESTIAQEKNIADFKLNVAQNYVTHNDLSKAIEAFNRSIDAVFKKLERIEDKLDSKADKIGIVHG